MMNTKHYMHPDYVRKRIEIYGYDPATDPLIQQEAENRLRWKEDELLSEEEDELPSEEED